MHERARVLRSRTFRNFHLQTWHAPQSRAVSATMRVYCSTDFAVCVTAASADLGVALLTIDG